MRPHRWQPTRLPRPWGSPGNNTGVGCHFLLQCMEVKRESEVGQLCPTLSNPMDCTLPGSSIHGIFQARVLEWGAIAFSAYLHRLLKPFWFPLLGFPGSSEVKVSVCNMGDPGSIPGLGRSPGEGNGNPLQDSCLENPMDREAWWATVRGVAKSWTRLSDFTYLLPLT